MAPEARARLPAKLSVPMPVTPGARAPPERTEV